VGGIALEVRVKLGARVIATVSAILLAASAAGARPAEVRVGVVLKALDNPFFVAMYEGVSAEAERRGVDASVRAVKTNGDLAAQAALVRELVARKEDCYVVNPIAATNLVDALRGAKGPVVNIDSPIDPDAARRGGVRIRSFIGTNDFAAGRAAATKMVSLLHGTGTVALVGASAGNVNSMRRVSGFEQGIRGTAVSVIARVNADYSRPKAEVAAERILHRHPRLSGFFAVNDEMALGVVDAVRATGRTGVAIVGVDGIPEALDAVREGTISATVSQYPYVMGQMAIEACIAVARGAPVPARVDAPIAVVTKSNVARASASFPRPFVGYSDPFERLLKAKTKTKPKTKR
jgi:ribose transport system substrate-binding protein